MLVSYHTSQPSSEMASYKNLTQFKLFLSDTGLFTTLMFKNKAFTDNDLYRKLLGDKLPANLGYLYENLIAQCLAAAGYELYYHTFPNKEKTKNYEIDFLIAKGNKICPIEVKSASIKRHASIDAFGRKYTAQIADKYLLGTKEQQKEQDLRILPVYMTSFL